MNAIRKLQFMFRGYLDFTKRNQPLPPLGGTLNGKTFVITGGNSGIGYSAAKGAAIKGAIVVLMCRSKQRGVKAVESLKEETKNPSISLVLCQIGNVESMRKAVDQLKEQYKTIDILVHNGGCMVHDQKFTEQGIESNFATNTFGVYYLSRLVMSMMTPTSRTIVVSSGGCLTEKLVVRDIYMQEEKFDGTTQYARNKRQQLCMIEELAKRYPNNGKFFTMHPGWVDTQAIREAMPDFYQKMKDKLREPDDGADTILYLSVAELEQLKNGEFYFDREVADKHLTIALTSYKQKEADALMEKLEKLSKLD